MSRPISYTSAVTVNVATYSGATSYVTTATTNPPSSGLYSSANTTNYASFSATSTSSGFAYYLFSVTVPTSATINSIACTARGRTSATSSGTSSFQLFAGSTAKGSQTTFTTTSVSAMNLTVGNWTAAEVNSGVALRIGTRRSSSTRAYSTRFYGATLTINYTVNSTMYEITASSEYTGATVSPATQEAMAGDSGYVKIFPDDLNNIIVEDNGSDVTSSLEYVAPTPGTFTLTGVPVSYDSVHSSVAGIASDSGVTNGFTPATSTTRVSISSNTQANSETNIYFNFDCSSIPENAVINSVACQAKAVISSGYFPTRIIQLCAGTTKKGSPTTVTNSSINNTVNVQTIADTGTWTREELDDIKILVQGIRTTSTSNFNISFYGATLTVNYTVPDEPYFRYTLTNVSADHDVVVKQSVIIPPDEDPTKTYYSITVSSINATTDPGRGTTRVESGTGQTITITPSDPQLTLALDNGVDITSQLVDHSSSTPTSGITTTAPNASYGFAYSSSTGYYVSQNKGVSTSAAVCIVTFNLPVRCLVTFQYINYAEATYDFGIFGNVDVPLNNNYKPANGDMPDSDYKLACNTNAYNSSSEQTLTYEIPAGEHSIYIKFSKDEATNSNNDTLQFKVASIEPLEPTNYYTYQLNNINADHSLVFIFGDVTYYFVTSSTDGTAKLYPDGQMVQLPGDTYRLVVVPENTGDTITVRDNNVDVTGSVVRKQETIEKDGQTITVINYIYELSNVQTGHTITVSSSGTNTPFVKVNGDWAQLTAIWKKVNGTWQQQDLDSEIFDDGTLYVRKN